MKDEATNADWRDNLAQTCGFADYEMFTQTHPDRDLIEYSFEHEYFKKFTPPPPPKARIYKIDGRKAAFVEDYVQWLFWRRVKAPPLSVKQIVTRIRSGQIEGFKDERVMRPSVGWMVFLDSAKEYFQY